ncbi:TPA: CPBP family intramembrane metalloprotease [Candidatus Dependentiae bacterium]|nr:MAG: Caax amino protease family protein [candidate division TM6 bacterium GW2011_GWF2_43_87]HBL98281.1 CPBP family intramembrane metalloprotease [Candidatus Dependentiae bacterium]
MQPTHTYKPIHFFLITFLLTWIPWFISAYFSYQVTGTDLQFLFMGIGLFGPCVATLILLSGSNNKNLRKDFYDRLSFRKIKLRFLPTLLLLLPIVLFLATTISLIFGRSIDQFSLASQYKIMRGQSLISLLILFLAPTLEELGWRGYGVDSLMSKFTLWKTTLLFASLWALWHLPLFFINGYYHHELWNTNIVYVINFFVSILPATILINWIYYKNNRSIQAAIMFHVMFNLSSVLFQTEQFTKCIITVLLLIISTIIVLQNKKFFFNKKVLA